MTGFNTTNLLSCRNIISDVSDHFSQFCIISNNVIKSRVNNSTKVHDFSQFSESKFLGDLSNINWTRIVSSRNMPAFYNKFNRRFNTHAPFKTVSKQMAKQLSKPWITKGNKDIN